MCNITTVNHIKIKFKFKLPQQINQISIWSYILFCWRKLVEKGGDFTVHRMCVQEYIRIEREGVKVVGQRWYYGLYMRSVQNAVASNKYKCEGYVCNDGIPYMNLKDRQRCSVTNWIKINYPYTFTQLIDACLSYIWASERTTVSECEFDFVVFVWCMC